MNLIKVLKFILNIIPEVIVLVSSLGKSKKSKNKDTEDDDSSPSEI